MSYEGPSEKAVVSATGLEKHYGPIHALKQVDVSIESGESVVLIGPNGAGKTTFLEILSGLRDFDEGSVSLFGADVRSKSREFATRIGVQLQETKLFLRLTPLEYFAFFADLYEKHVDIDELIDSLDLRPYLNLKIGQMSGGLRQRTGLALSLINDPDLILLDEPTVGLDPIARHDFWAIINALRERKKTILLTTHYMEEAMSLADRIVMLARGEVVFNGPPAQVTEMAAKMDGSLDAVYVHYANGEGAIA